MAKGKITALKKVYWKSAGKTMEGKVKQVMADHVVVETQDGSYIVRKAILSLKPIEG